MFPVALASMGATLIASPERDPEKYAPPAVVEAEERLATAGQVLGAASMCKEVSRARLKIAMLKIQALIDKGVDDNRQYYAAQNIFSKGVDKGKGSVKKGETDCEHANAELTNLEKVLGP